MYNTLNPGIADAASADALIGAPPAVPHDLVQLEDLTEAVLLDGVKRRYQADLIYTWVGDVLLALNPYRRLPIYGQGLAMK